MVQIIKATSEQEPIIPLGFPILVDNNMELLTPFNRYLQYKCVTRGKVNSMDTMNAYSFILLDINQFFEDNNIQWNEVLTEELADYRNRMVQSLSPHTKRPYSDRTVNAYIRLATNCFNWLYENNYLISNPIKTEKALKKHRIKSFLEHVAPAVEQEVNVLTLKETKRPIKALNDMELRLLRNQIINSVSSHKNRDLLMHDTVVTTGVRALELCGLSVNGLLKGGNRVQVHYGMKKMMITITKGRSPRNVYLLEPLYKQLLDYVHIDREKVLLKARLLSSRKGVEFPEPKELFLGENGKGIDRKYFGVIIKNYAKEVGIYGVGPHCLRHTFAIVMYKILQNFGVKNPWKVIQVLLGHKSLSTTLDVYLDSVDVDEIEISESLEHLYNSVLLGNYNG